MKSNMGLMDKNIRRVLSVIFLLVALLTNIDPVIKIILIALAVIFIITTLISWCPLYAPFKISTKK